MIMGEKKNVKNRELLEIGSIEALRKELDEAAEDEFAEDSELPTIVTKVCVIACWLHRSFHYTAVITEEVNICFSGLFEHAPDTFFFFQLPCGTTKVQRGHCLFVPSVAQPQRGSLSRYLSISAHSSFDCVAVSQARKPFVSRRLLGAC